MRDAVGDVIVATMDEIIDAHASVACANAVNYLHGSEYKDDLVKLDCDGIAAMSTDLSVQTHVWAIKLPVHVTERSISPHILFRHPFVCL